MIKEKEMYRYIKSNCHSQIICNTIWLTIYRSCANNDKNRLNFDIHSKMKLCNYDIAASKLIAL